MKKRLEHRRYQIYLKDTLTSLDLMTREKTIAFRVAIKELLSTEEQILPPNTDKKAVELDTEKIAEGEVTLIL